MKKIIQDKQLLIRRIFLMCYDVLAVFAASIVALLIRFDLNIKSVPFQYMDEVWRALPFMIIVTLVIFWLLRLYSSLWSYAGALEMMYVVSACILDTVVVTVLILLRNWGDMYPVPRSFYILYGLFLFVLVMGCRYSYRGLRVLRNMRRAGVYRRNVLVIGAGDAGNQIINLGKSLQARYREYLGLPFSLPEDGYHGEDVKEIAVSLAKAHQDAYAEETEENLAFFKQKGIEFELEKIRKDLDYYRVHFDVWSSEQAIRDAGKVEAALKVLKEKGLTYEKEGALWFETTRFGDDKDRVLRKTDGSYTYLVPDIAYHKDKMDRGYDLLVDFFGADHHGYVPRLKASIAALGNDPERLAVDIIQMVRLVENGQEVKMSKRLGNAVTIRELCDEVGVDAARYFFVQRALDTHLDFDLGLARSQSNDNPVYYAQYAHARMCSILRQAQDVPEASSYERLTHEKEADLMKYINEFTSVVSEAARLRAPHKVCNYIQKLAQKFHSFYNACKVIDREDMELSAQRLDLVKAARITLGNALELIGVEAPEKM